MGCNKGRQRVLGGRGARRCWPRGACLHHPLPASQSYRAAMAVLRQQRAFIASLYERGAVDEEEREELGAAWYGAMRQLDMTGPHWRPPSPLQVVRSLDAFSAAPADLVAALVQQAALADLPARGAGVASQGGGGDGAPAAGGFYLVVSGVVCGSGTSRLMARPPRRCRCGAGRAPGQTGAGASLPPTLSSALSTLSLCSALLPCSPTSQGVGAIFGGAARPVRRAPAWRGAHRGLRQLFGRGPLIYHFPASAVDMLRQR